MTFDPVQALAALDGAKASNEEAYQVAADGLAAFQSQAAQLATCQMDLAETQSDLAAATLALSAIQAQLTAAQQLLASASRLKQLLDLFRPPARFLVGASIMDPRLGALPLQRAYFTQKPGAPTARPRVTSFKTWDEPAVTAYIKAAPAGEYLTYWHEPENDIDRGHLTAQTWAAHQLRLTQIIVEQGRAGQVFPCTILMRWSIEAASKRGVMLSQLLTPELLAALRAARGVLAWDAYPSKYTAGAPNVSPDVMFGTAARYSAALGLDWAVGETSTDATKATDAKATAAWWQSVMDYLGDYGLELPSVPRFLLAWTSTSQSDAAYAMQNVPEVAAVWAQAAGRFCPPS